MTTDYVDNYNEADNDDDIPRAQKTPNEFIFNTETSIIISLLIIMEI